MKKKETGRLSKIDTLFWLISEIKIFKISRIYLSRLCMTICIAFFPRLTHFFSIGDKLPSKKFRIKKTSNPLNDWTFLNNKKKEIKKKPSNETVYVFFKRETPEFLKVKYKKNKKYLVNWEKVSDGKNIFYATSDSQALSFFILKKMQPCFYVEPFYYDDKGKKWVHKAIRKKVNLDCPSGINYNHIVFADPIKILSKNKKNKNILISHKMSVSTKVSPNPGSGVTVLLSLMKIYKNIIVHGLDLYQSKKLHTQSFFYCLLSISRHFKAIFYQQHHMENLIYQYIYLNRISKNKSIKIFGNAAKIGKHKKLMKNLEKIIYY
jgi:hypothetical protein